MPTAAHAARCLIQTGGV
jgi:hypothetical protein